MPGSLASRLQRLRQRLDLLQHAPPRRGGPLGWLLGNLAPAEVDVSLPNLTELDRQLDRVGVHTVADAELLRALGARKGRVGAVAEGMLERAQVALEEYESALQGLERMHRAGRTQPGARMAMERSFVRLARVLKVAELFSSPEEAEQDFEIYERPRAAWSERPPTRARMAVAEFLAERARTNVEDVQQKRRDLDMAHEMLLRIGMDHDRDRSVVLRHEVAQARERVRAMPVSRSLEELVGELRHNARRDPQWAYRSLRALYERALEAQQPALAATARAALEPLLPPPSTLRSLVESSERDELLRWMGDEPSEAGARGSRDKAQPKPQSPHSNELLADLAFSLSPEQLATFELASGCSRYFDVEDTLAEEVVAADERTLRPVPRRVPYPTQTMTFETTGSLHEVHNFVLTDPRLLLYDLASHRQPVRAYLEQEPPPRPRKVRRSAVRVYVCDASGSMHGPRARFRDALIIAELNNLRAKARRDEPFDPLYFSFFNDAPTTLLRVDTAEEATRQIEKLFHHSPAEGLTDITVALLGAFESIRAAQGRDPHLARATVVIITDGEDRVDLEKIRRARAPIGALDIALSFISLGDENPDLKSLVQEQRSQGSRAFYHHLSDAEIQWARTEFDSPWRTLLPREVPLTSEALEALLPHLDALESLAAGRGPQAPVAVEASFEALFPEKPPDKPQSTKAPPQEVHSRVADILDALVEAAALAPVDRRSTESLTLLQHLLGVYGIAPGQYLDCLATGGPEVRDRLARVRLLCRPFG